MKVDGPLDVGWLGEFTLQDFTIRRFYLVQTSIPPLIIIRASFSSKSGV
jgi:hypothetical protein